MWCYEGWLAPDSQCVFIENCDKIQPKWYATPHWITTTQNKDICPQDNLKVVEENKITTMDKFDNEIWPFTDLQSCCRRSFATDKGMRIYPTKVGYLSRRPCKSQPKISKLIEVNHCQENYHRTMVPFGCQPQKVNVKKNAIRINWLRANGTKLKTLDEELSFILRTSLKGLSLWSCILSQILCMQCDLIRKPVKP